MQHPTIPQLPRVQRENPPGVRRSPRQHTQSVQQIPTRATYSITITDKKSVNSCLKHASNQLLEKIIPKLKPTSTLSSTPSKQQPFDAFLYPTINHIYNDIGKKQTIYQLLASHQKERLNNALSDEFGRLAQMNLHGVTHTDKIDFI